MLGEFPPSSPWLRKTSAPFLEAQRGALADGPYRVARLRTDAGSLFPAAPWTVPAVRRAPPYQPRWTSMAGQSTQKALMERMVQMCRSLW